MRPFIAILICLTLLASSGVARAAVADRVAPDPLTIRDLGLSLDAAMRDSLGLKSPGGAARRSLLCTVVPFLMGSALGDEEGVVGAIGMTATVASVFVGPSVGYFYGGCGRRAIKGIAIRAGLAGIAAIAASQAEWPSMDLFGSGGDQGNAAAGIAVLAGCAVLVDVVIDLLQVSGTVRRENDRRMHEQPAVGFSLRF
jgi:hypothetical protein